MNIFIISRGYPSVKDPQWGNFETDQARALAKCGHKVTMLSIDVRYSTLKNRLGITKIEENGVVSYSLNLGPWVISKVLSVNLYYWICKKLLLKLYEMIVKQEGIPELIYSHYQDLSLSALGIKEKYKIPVVGLEHWSALGLNEIPKIAIKHGRYVYKNLDKVLVVSDFLKRKIKTVFNIDSEIVNNIVGDQFNYKGYINNTGIINFVLVGNLIPRKNFDIVIRAVKEIVGQHNNIKFTIVGDGPEREHLKELIKEYELVDYIQLIGRKSRERIVELLQKADVFILSSSSETFGVAAVEALACGVPVIATDCGGTKDFMDKDNGLLIPVNNIEAMCAAIIHMIRHHKEYNRRNIADNCKKKFSSESIGRQLSFIFELISKK